MELKHIETLYFTFDEDGYWTYDELDEKMKLDKLSDFALVYTKDNEKIKVSKANFNGGSCDCCSAWNDNKIIKIEYYKLETEK